jgi:hypothetical protein
VSIIGKLVLQVMDYIEYLAQQLLQRAVIIQQHLACSVLHGDKFKPTLEVIDHSEI